MEHQERIAALFDEVADSYDNVGVDFFQPIATGLVAYLDPKSGERALDIGCGRGAVLCLIAPLVGPSGTVTGLDLSPRMVELAKAAAAEAGVAAEIRTGDAMAPDVAPQSVDLVASSLVLFFLPDPLAALRAWHGLLAPGGRIGVSTFGSIDRRWTDTVTARFADYVPYQGAGQAPPFDSDDAMEALMAEAGFRGVRTESGVVSPRFDDAEHWYRWSMSAGQRRFWQALPEERRDEAKAALSRAVEECRHADGRLGFDQGVRYTLAEA